MHISLLLLLVPKRAYSRTFAPDYWKDMTWRVFRHTVLTEYSIDYFERRIGIWANLCCSDHFDTQHNLLCAPLNAIFSAVVVIVERAESTTGEPDVGDDSDNTDYTDNTNDGRNKNQKGTRKLDLGLLCFLPHTQGLLTCNAHIVRYHYNYRKRKCERIVYGGCNATWNNFKTRSECQRKCAWRDLKTSKNPKSG